MRPAAASVRGRGLLWVGSMRAGARPARSAPRPLVRYVARQYAVATSVRFSRISARFFRSAIDRSFSA